jgi:hypothetical protein
MISNTMLKMIQEWMKDYEAVQSELRDMGIINYCSPYIGVVSWIDHKQLEKYFNDRQNTVSKDNRKTKS